MKNIYVKKECINCFMGLLSVINTDTAWAFLANRNYHFEVFWSVLSFFLVNFVFISLNVIQVDKLGAFRGVPYGANLWRVRALYTAA